MSSGAPTITQLTWVPCTFTSTILRTTNNSPTVVHAHRIKIHLVRPISGVACSNGCVDLSGTDYSGDFEGDITEDRPLVSLRTPHVTFPTNTGCSRHIVQRAGVVT